MLILLLSIYGRALQSWVEDHLGYTAVAWIVALTLLALIMLYLFRGQPDSPSLPWMNLLWVLPLFVLLPLSLERVEERIHFLVFGVYGALSLLLFGPRAALLMCLLGAAGDEVLQYFLPDRVGDWRDVVMNFVAALGAALFMLATMPESKKRGMQGD